MTTTLEKVIPVYHFHERHQRLILASADEVWAALTTLGSDQLRITKVLMSIRHLGMRTQSVSRNLFSDGPVRMFTQVEPGYAVGGAVMQPWKPRAPRRAVDSLDAFVAFDEPGWTKVLTDFRLDETRNGTLLITETRGYSTDPSSRRRFAIYWSVIQWGSRVVRRDMLAAVARSAEHAASTP